MRVVRRLLTSLPFVATVAAWAGGPTPALVALDGGRLCEAALEHVAGVVGTQPPGASFEARCGEAVPQLSVPVGTVSLKAADQRVPLDGPNDVLLQVAVDGRPVRLVRVPLQVRWLVPQWCAKEAFPAGSTLDESRFAGCLWPVTRADQLVLAGKPLPSGRAARALREGEPLRVRDVAGGDRRLMGEAVSVVYRAGALAVESQGELAQEARVGEPVRVRMQGGQMLAGRLVATNRVEIEEQR